MICELQIYQTLHFDRPNSLQKWADQNSMSCLRALAAFATILRSLFCRTWFLGEIYVWTCTSTSAQRTFFICDRPSSSFELIIEFGICVNPIQFVSSDLGCWIWAGFCSFRCSISCEGMEFDDIHIWSTWFAVVSYLKLSMFVILEQKLKSIPLSFLWHFTKSNWSSIIVRFLCKSGISDSILHNLLFFNVYFVINLLTYFRDLLVCFLACLLQCMGIFSDIVRFIKMFLQLDNGWSVICLYPRHFHVVRDFMAIYNTNTNPYKETYRLAHR